MKQIYLITGMMLAITFTYAEENTADSLVLQNLDEIVLISSAKETNDIKTIPSAISIVAPDVVKTSQIIALKDLSGYIPNLFIPDYGSRMTSAIYIRGIGARSSGQSVGLYVDNVPYMDKSAFDFDLMDIQQIEVLRGPQGTLYGRNAMGGIVNIYTKSPWYYQGTNISVGGGNHGTMRGQISHFGKISEDLAFSLSGYYNRNEGFFKNAYDGKRVDEQENAGGKFKLEWLFADSWKMAYTINYDYTDQGAFPYGAYDPETGKTSSVDYNDKGSYTRNTLTNSILLSQENDRFLFTSTTAYQYHHDNMWMDQDYSRLSIFTLNQKQKQNSFNEEVTFRSNTNNNYQWSTGAFGFYNSFNTKAPVLFKQDGIQTILQPVFDNLLLENPTMPVIKITDTETKIPGDFDTPSYGAALYHQSTYNNLFTEGLSVTAGLRLDYERAKLKYNTHTAMNMTVQPQNMHFPIPMLATDTLIGKESKEFLQLLPKFSVKYEFNSNSFIYATAAKGYKTGGYNIQMFSDIVQERMMNKYKNMVGGGSSETGDEVSIKDIASFDPEYSWNYEIGTRTVLIPGKLNMELTFFYIDVNDIQLTKFVPTGKGRMIVNAGEATSKGFEASFNGELLKNLTYAVNYGYTHATFDDYKTNAKDEDGNLIEIDYSGNYIPFSPRNTLSGALNYRWNINKSFLDNILFSAQYTGAGKIYWTEANDVAQDYYSTLNARIAFVKDNMELSAWGKNLTDTDYHTFYFESMGKGYVQYAKPLQFGVDFSVKF